MKKGRGAPRLARRRFLAAVPAAMTAGLAARASAQEPQAAHRIGRSELECAEKIIGVDFSETQQDAALNAVNGNLRNFERLRQLPVPLDTEPAIAFRPYLPGRRPQPGATPHAPLPLARQAPPARWSSLDDLAFLPVTALAALLRSRRVSSTELTRMYLARLRQFGPRLNCVVTLTDDLALAQAAAADREIRAGRYRGPLHGIPWGAKDLFATRGIPTTWGAAPFQQQIFDYDATVVERLREAGAVLAAKLSLGALAQGDRWFGGQTKNPWHPDDERRGGSSGSSAGPGAATAAGLVGFSLGTETRGSIISPSAVNGVVGLRPTYGRVSRYGAMALSWTMDKIGPMCRSVEDCALVFNAIYGPDGRDETVVDAPFTWRPEAPVARLRIGYVKAEFDALAQGTGRGAGGTLTPDARAARAKLLHDALDVFRGAGAALEPMELPGGDIVPAIGFILSVEAAAAFDDLTRSEAGNDPSLNTWPNTFRAHRYVPAVEYIRAQRARTLLMRQMDEVMSRYDLFLTPTASPSLSLTNLTGHPALALRAGFADGAPIELMLTGRLFDEGTLLGAGLAYERATTWHTVTPELDA